MREAEMADLKKQVAELDAAAKGIATDFDPLDLKEATKWEPKAASASETPAETESASPSVALETSDAGAPAEPVAASAPQPSSGESAVAAPPAADAGSTAEPAPMPLTEGGGRA